MQLTEEDKEQLLYEEALERQENYMRATRIRMTARKCCNARLNLYYVVSTDGVEVKTLFLFFDRLKIAAVTCADREKSKLAMTLLKELGKVNTVEELDNLCKRFGIEVILPR